AHVLREGDAAGSGDFDLVALAVIEAQGVRPVALGNGNSQRSGRVEASAQKHDGALVPGDLVHFPHGPPIDFALITSVGLLRPGEPLQVLTSISFAPLGIPYGPMTPFGQSLVMVPLTLKSARL